MKTALAAVVTLALAQAPAWANRKASASGPAQAGPVLRLVETPAPLTGATSIADAPVLGRGDAGLAPGSAAESVQATAVAGSLETAASAAETAPSALALAALPQLTAAPSVMGAALMTFSAA